MHSRLTLYLFTFCAALLLTSCNITRYVPDGNYLLYGVKIKCDNKNIKSYDVEPYVRQLPNTKLFDTFPFNLALYSWSSPDTALWINRFLRKIGDAPVVYDPNMTSASEVEIKKFMANKGYESAVVTSEVKFKKKKARVTYNIESGRPYTIRKFRFAVRDSVMHNIILADSSKTLIKSGNNFDTDVLESERTRLTNLLRDNGYYEFDKQYVGVVADSTVGDHEVDLLVIVKPMKRPLGMGKYSLEKHQQYTINKVNYFALKEGTNVLDNTLLRTGLKESSYKNVTVKSNVRLIRPKALYRKTLLEPGELFNQSNIDKTYSKLTSLHIFKYQNIAPVIVGDSADHKLDLNVIMTPDKVQSISAQIEGTNNEGDFGIAGKISYTHANIFRGGEEFKLSVRGANESLIGKRTIWEVSTEASLGFPIMLMPFLTKNFIRNNNARTEVYLNFSYQIRKDYSRIIAGTGIRYKWSDSHKLNHQVDLVDFNYVYLPYMSDSLKKTISKSLLKYSYEDHLIMRTGYTLSYTTQKLNVYRNNYSVKWAIETAGNLLYGICAAANATKNDNGSYIIGKTPFAQYVKTDFDFCFRHVIDTKNTVAYHIAMGIGVPYVNSTILPFEKRYYGGGANSVRGWSARSLGPGNYNANGAIDYMKQSGDINLCLNIEYRTRLVWKLELAAFLDAGNIWTLKDEGQAEGQFRIDRFYKQIAFGYGIGLRLNFDFFVIRLDWGIKAFDPSQAAGKQWRFVPGWNITKDTALHLAVGYPF